MFLTEWQMIKMMTIKMDTRANLCSLRLRLESRVRRSVLMIHEGQLELSFQCYHVIHVAPLI